MIDIKYMIKKILCPLQCIRYGIKNKKNYLYIGKKTKIINPKNIYFGENVNIMPYNMLIAHNKKSKLIIGKNVDIGMYSRIACLNRIKIGDNVFTGPHIFISDYNHEYRNPNIPIKYQGNLEKNYRSNCGVDIGDDTWIGTNVVIAGSIKIGKHCVIGANSVVTKDIPDYCVVGGSPAEIIKFYNFEHEKWEYFRP